jgi:hypothetical protein
MPAARRSTRSSSRSSAFKEPAALGRLTKSLDTAQDALAELSKQGGRDVGQSAGAIYKDLRTFLSSARRHSGRLGKALARDFDQAQKQLAKSATASSTRGGSSRSTTKRASASRSATTKAGSRSRSTGAGKRASASSGAGKRASKATGASKRASTASRRGTRRTK